jgi:hypothetical protein
MSSSKTSAAGLELVRAESQHVGEMGRICYEAFKDLYDRHHFPLDLPSAALARANYLGAAGVVPKAARGNGKATCSLDTMCSRLRHPLARSRRRSQHRGTLTRRTGAGRFPAALNPALHPTTATGRRAEGEATVRPRRVSAQSLSGRRIYHWSAGTRSPLRHQRGGTAQSRGGEPGLV